MKTKTEKGPMLIGRGQLNWNRYERQSDRYGYVHMYVQGTDWQQHSELFVAEGHGRLEAVVTEPIASEHIGDLARGIGQEKVPEVGDKFVLGEGDFTSITVEGILNIGVKPKDGREDDWMDPQALYNCHNSVVELHWYPI